MEFRRVGFILLIVWLLIPFCASAQDSLNVHKVGAFFDYWGNIEHFSIDGDRLVISNRYSGLFVLDVSNPNSPEKICFIDNPYPGEVLINGDYIYVVYSGSGRSFRVYDISNTDQPFECGRISIEENYHNLVYVDGIVYMTDYLIREHVTEIIQIDVNDPFNPQVQSNTSFDSQFFKFTIEEDNLFYTSGDTLGNSYLSIINIEESGELSHLSSALIDTSYNHGLGKNIFIDGNTAFVVSTYKVFAFDVSDLDSPSIISEYEGTLRIQDASIAGDIIYTQGYGEMWALDVSNPSNIHQVESYTPEELLPNSSSPYFIFHKVSNDLMFMVDSNDLEAGGANIFIVDASDYESLQEIGYYKNQSCMRSLYNSQDHLFIADYDSVQIVDVSNLEDPVKQGVIKKQLKQISVYGNSLYGINRSWGSTIEDLLFIYDISDGNNPTVIDSMDLGQSPLVMSSSEDYLFIANGSRMFYLLSITSSSSVPSILHNFYRGNLRVFNSVIDGNNIYILGGYEGSDVEDGLLIMDIDEEGHITDAGSFSMLDPNGHRYSTIKYANGVVLLMNTNHYALIDVSYPESPTLLSGGEIEGRGCYNFARMDDDVLLLASDYDISVLDISDPSMPEEVGFYRDEERYIYDYCSTGDLIYSTNGHRIQVFNFSDALTVEQKFINDMPSKFSISNAYPNPFNPTLNVQVSLPETGLLRLTVHNLLGQEVAVMNDQSMSAGYHTFTFDGSDLSSGIYFVKAVVEGKMNDVQKVVLMK